MGAALADTLSLIIRSLGSLLLLAVLLRFLLQAVRADFYNPVSQAIVKITASMSCGRISDQKSSTSRDFEKKRWPPMSKRKPL